MRTVSIISIVYGTLGLLWAALVSLLIRIHSAVFENIPWPPEVYDFIDLPAFLDSIYGVMGTVFPFVFLIAILYIISGILQLSEKPAFKNLAYAAAILNIVWYIVYIVVIQVEIVPLFNTIEFFPKNVMNYLFLAGSIFNGIFYCGYPVFLIIYLNRGGKPWDTIETGYTS
jgi:hypothetical protein